MTNCDAWNFDATKWEPWPFKRQDEQAARQENSISSGPVLHTDIDEGRPLDLPPAKPPISIPGLVGELVEHCWNGAAYQVAEVALASALSMMSLLCSRVYRHGTLGLSLYLLVLAKTSTGKSFMFKANDALTIALANSFVGTMPPHYRGAKDRQAAARNLILGELGSAQGLAQHMAVSPSTLFHGDEWVHKMKEMARPNPPQYIAQLQEELLRLVEMSGPGRVYRGRKYSKRSNIAEEVDVPMASLSILACGTPEKFYNDLSPSLFENGFLPRFTILEYAGNICKKNKDENTVVPKTLLDRLAYLFNQQYVKGPNLTGDLSEVIDVQPLDHAAASKIEWFHNVCIRRNRDANDRELPTGGLWARGKEHAIQIASLIAIGIDPSNPKIEESHIEIAIKLVMPSLENLSSKFENNQIGIGDDRRLAEIRRVMASMYVFGFEKFKKKSGLIKEELINNGIIQLSYVKKHCTSRAAFRNHPLGSIKSFDDTLNSMLRDKEIKEVSSDRERRFVLEDMDVFMPIFEQVKRVDR